MIKLKLKYILYLVVQHSNKLFLLIKIYVKPSIIKIGGASPFSQKLTFLKNISCIVA
jgi:hypothetical protein